MRWLLIGIVILANVAGLFFALIPTLVTFAEISPSEINCASCNSPEVIAALTQAVGIGRSQVIGVVSSYIWFLVAAAGFNVIAVITALFMARPNLIDGS